MLRDTNRTPVLVPAQAEIEGGTMALTRISPVEARVDWDQRRSQPRLVSWNGKRLAVTGTTSVRDERAAYPIGRGPRVTYLLQTDDGGQASLVFDGRRRRWYVEAIDPAA
jgi:hypothetical protein